MRWRKIRHGNYGWNGTKFYIMHYVESINVKVILISFEIASNMKNIDFDVII